jgi:hypothetical protein
MKRIFDHLRDRLEKAAGLIPPPKSKFSPSDLARLEQTEWSLEFERLMRNRLIMGALRYNTFAENRQHPAHKQWPFKQKLATMIDAYEATGNTEFLVDAANYCLLAFEFDPHPTKHFYAQDR